MSRIVVDILPCTDTDYLAFLIKSQRDSTLELSLPPEELVFILGIPGAYAVKAFTEREDLQKAILDRWGASVADFIHLARPFAGIEHLLLQLKERGYKLGIVTSKTKEEMESEFAPFGLTHCFEVVVTASDTKRHKPAPDPLLEAMRQMDVTPDRVVYIGDAVYDLECAKASQVAFALAEWGAKDRSAFKEVEYVLRSPSDLHQLLIP